MSINVYLSPRVRGEMALYPRNRKTKKMSVSEKELGGKHGLEDRLVLLFMLYQFNILEARDNTDLYQYMYTGLFNAVTDSLSDLKSGALSAGIDRLERAQQASEEMFISGLIRPHSAEDIRKLWKAKRQQLIKLIECLMEDGGEE